MLRMFDEHEVRPVISLNGIWQLTGERGTGPAMVPGVWDTIPAWNGFQGQAVFERQVEVPRDCPVLLRFGGVSHTADVFWDGVHVGSHYNAFTGFDVLLPAVKNGTHTLKVKVDNRFGPDSALHVPNDYMTYGGISRGVEMHLLPGCWISRMSFCALHAEEGYKAQVRVWVRSLADLDGITLNVSVAGACASRELSVRAGETEEVSLELGPVRAEEWDVLKPRLYTLKARLSSGETVLDDLLDRVGFRTVEVKDERILINRRPVEIRGFNRHEDDGNYGCAVTPGSMMQDLYLLLDMGGNSIRTCHYPNDPRFLDLCDELGILVWEEHHARALSGEILRSDVFSRQISACNEEMITQHINHPCIYVWGVLNECESETEFGRELYARNLRQLRELDPGRPVTYATCRLMKDVCLDLADIVSWNIYPLWYENTPPSDMLDELLTWSDAHGAAGKSVLVSEIGAGGIYGFHDGFRRAKWSEERQAEILRQQLEAVFSNPRVSGLYVWQLADVKVDESWFKVRPGTMNNKGVVDTYRRPKLAYGTVKEIFRDRAGGDSGKNTES